MLTGMPLASAASTVIRISLYMALLVGWKYRSALVTSRPAAWVYWVRSLVPMTKNSHPCRTKSSAVRQAAGMLSMIPKGTSGL